MFLCHSGSIGMTFLLFLLSVDDTYGYSEEKSRKYCGNGQVSRQKSKDHLTSSHLKFPIALKHISNFCLQ